MIGRCRRHSPTMTGYPVCYDTDWCGDHKLDESKVTHTPTGPDPWRHRSQGLRCGTCMFFVAKIAPQEG